MDVYLKYEIYKLSLFFFLDFETDYVRYIDENLRNLKSKYLN
jgi:hypothetical protein